ncbi:hypothetical protein DH2020_028023 [Rehmannia glutinosa]|uniref:Ethylene insensitive 3-like DNA-binding domain-containing protein n=1 Tax=Rehmannia glutinosa TaxID=99300 RepID=A0ABR0VVV6_REHGL
MWRDKMRLKRLKEMNKGKENLDSAKQRQSQEQARRKKMSRAQDGILKYMLKMMEVCKAQGFVYAGLSRERETRERASDNLREWWKDKVRFDRNGPAAIAKLLEEEKTGQRTEYDDGSTDIHVRVSSLSTQRNSPWFSRSSFEGQSSTLLPVQAISRFQSFKFQHERSQAGRVSSILRPTKTGCYEPYTTYIRSVSGLGVPEDGQRMINDLMSLYDNNVQENKCQQDGYLGNQGIVLEGNIFEDNNNTPIFRPADRFDHCKVINSPFNNAENFPLMFSSPFNVPSVDYTDGFPGVPRDNLPKQDFTMWY